MWNISILSQVDSVLGRRESFGVQQRRPHESLRNNFIIFASSERSNDYNSPLRNRFNTETVGSIIVSIYGITASIDIQSWSMTLSLYSTWRFSQLFDLVMSSWLKQIFCKISFAMCSEECVLEFFIFEEDCFFSRVSFKRILRREREKGKWRLSLMNKRRLAHLLQNSHQQLIHVVLDATRSLNEFNVSTCC